AGRLWQRVVGGVADQQMAEAVGVLAHELRLVRADELFAHKPGQPAFDVCFLWRERLHCATVEDAAFDRATLEYAALGRLELVEPRREQRLDCPGHRDLAIPRLLDECDHRLHQPRVALRSLADARAQLWLERRLAEQPLEQLV